MEVNLWENVMLSCFHIWMGKETEDIRNPCFVYLRLFDSGAGIIMRRSLQTRCYLPALFSCASHKRVCLTLMDRK